MEPTSEQWQQTKWLCEILRKEGVIVIFRTTYRMRIRQAAIILKKKNLVYNFSDPDWDVVNKQLAYLAKDSLTI